MPMAMTAELQTFHGKRAGASRKRDVGRDSDNDGNDELWLAGAGWGEVARMVSLIRMSAMP